MRRVRSVPLDSNFCEELNQEERNTLLQQVNRRVTEQHSPVLQPCAWSCLAALAARLRPFPGLAVGVALIVGAFTGLAAFFGGFLSWNFVMAGTASSNALPFAIATWLVLAWKTAGWIGLDRWLLPPLGSPQRGKHRRLEPRGPETFC